MNIRLRYNSLKAINKLFSINRLNISSVNSIKSVYVKDLDGILRKVNVLDIPSLEADSQNKIPIVILLGTGQTIQTFSPHFRHFSKYSRLIIPELRRQGKTELLIQDCSMNQHIIDLEYILKGLNVSKCYIVGFSFGGRVSLAFAANRPGMVEKVSISCVPYTRPGGYVVVSKIYCFMI